MSKSQGLTLALAGCGLWLAGATAQPQVYSFLTIAGDASIGSADGTNNNARFNFPTGIAADGMGNLFIADSLNNTVRMLTPDGTNWVCRTIAGLAGSPGSFDGTNSSARFSYPKSITTDGTGNVFVTDAGNDSVRMLAKSGTNWVSATIAGITSIVAPDSDGNLFVAGSSAIQKLTRAGTNWISSTIAGLAGSPAPQGHFVDGTNSDARFGWLSGMVVSSGGTLFVADGVPVTDWVNFGIRMVTPVGTNWVTRTLVQTAAGPLGVAVDASNHLYVAASTGPVIAQVMAVGTNWVWSTIAGEWGLAGAADGTNAAARFYRPSAIAVNSAGNAYVADTGNNTIRKLAANGTNWVSSTIARLPPSSSSADGTNHAARFFAPHGVAAGSGGELYVADTGGHAIRKLERAGTNWVARTIAGLAGTPGSTDGTNSTALFSGPEGVATDGLGTVYVADTGNNTIRVLKASGGDWISSTIAGLAGTWNRQDGTNSDIRFSRPNAVTMDSSSNLYVAENEFQSVRKLTPVGTNWVSSTIADQTGPVSAPYPNGLAAASNGTLYMVDGRSTIDGLTPTGTDWAFGTLAGVRGIYGNIDGTNVDALFSSPSGIALDSGGRLYVTDARANTIRRLTPIGTNWVSSTIGGSADRNVGSADGTSVAARFNAPFGIAINGTGILYIADTGNNTIRMGLPLAAPAPVLRNVLQTNSSITFSWSSFIGLTYQPQYNSEVNSTNWTNLGNSVTATNETGSATDVLGAGRQRFYRVVLLPW
jgi:NHL repeat